MSTLNVTLTLLAAGLLCSAASSALAQGTLVTSLPEPLSLQSYFTMVQYPIDVNGDSITDFTFAADPSGLGLRTEGTNHVIVRLSPPPNIGGPVARIEEGASVGSSLDPVLAWTSSNPVRGYVEPGEIAFATLVQCLSTGCASDWPGGPATRAFIGFDFQLSDGLHYGYFDILMRGDIPGAELYGWGYNPVPGQSVFASLVPEPSAPALLAVGGILLWLLGRASRTRSHSAVDAAAHQTRHERNNYDT
jgi:hypothetical protein